MSEKATKERIIEAAEELMLAKSFHAVGLNEILKAVNVPKGSFYYHFKSKEDFGVEMIKHYIADCSRKEVEDFESLAGVDPITRILTFLEKNITRFVDNGCVCPCLIMKLSAEVSNFSEPMRLAVADGFACWVTHYSEFFEEAIQAGILSAETDTNKEAQFLVDLWYGACHRAIASRSAAPLRNALAYLKDHYLKKKN